MYVIAQSPKIPEITLCIKSEIDVVLREKLRDVLLNMDRISLGKEVLKKFEALRFVKSGKADFGKVEEMALGAWHGIAEHGKDR